MAKKPTAKSVAAAKHYDDAKSAGDDRADKNGKGDQAKQYDLPTHKKRSAKAWSDRDLFQKFFDDAYEFAIPFRRPASRLGKGAETIERLFDATAVESSFRAAGQLHQDLFPPDFAKLAPGAASKISMQKDELKGFQDQLEQISKIVGAFFTTGEFDTASSEMCIDLLVGTGTLFPLEGDDETPVRFVCIPFDEIAVENDAYGKVVAIFWKSKLTRRQIKNAFKNGKFPQDFINKHNSAPDEELNINQDFCRDPETGKWDFVVYLDDSTEPVEKNQYLTQPMAVPRYHRVPGEAYGRGPILLAMATIKTLNKAVELTLKSAAIQMLGIWGYRPGGSFNPDTIRMGPGEFWPMQATGGVLGPDVTRLDASAGKVDVGNLVTQELRMQVQSMLGDDKLPADGATPRSATEIMERMKRISKNYMGAWARIVNEVHPIIYRRVIEILYRRKLIPSDIKIDQLLIKLDVMSPITQSIKAAAHSRVIEFMQLVVAIKGDARALDLIVKVDDALKMIGADQIPSAFLQSEDETKAVYKQFAEMAATLHAAQNPKQEQPAAT